MADIYKAAENVVIYVGEEGDDSRLAMHLIVSHQKIHHFRMREATIRQRVALQRFFRRPWFSRVWVLQEIAWSK
jgi:hypothetical protein